MKFFMCAFQVLLTTFLVCSETEVHQLINGIEEIINFFKADYQNVNFDGFLGVVMTQAQLDAILKSKLNEKLFYRILILKNLCDDLVNLLKPKFDNNMLLKSKFWKPKLFRRENLFNLPTNDWSEKSDADLNNIFFGGHPNEEDSDECINELMNQKNTTNEYKQSIKCRKIMQNFEGTGYALTHKLLYWTILDRSQGILNENLMTTISYVLCSKILQQFKSLELLDDGKVQDLYMEQAVMCGLQGYQRFTTENSRKKIFEWMKSWEKFSCFGMLLTEQDRCRKKRAVQQMKNNCESHSSGIGMAVLSLNLRFLLYRMQYNNNEIT